MPFSVVWLGALVAIGAIATWMGLTYWALNYQSRFATRVVHSRVLWTINFLAWAGVLTWALVSKSPPALTALTALSALLLGMCVSGLWLAMMERIAPGIGCGPVDYYDAPVAFGCSVVVLIFGIILFGACLAIYVLKLS